MLPLVSGELRYNADREKKGHMPPLDDHSTLDDRELPDESDMDSGEADPFADTEPCPFCDKPIHEEAEICHHCGKYVPRDGRGGRTWTIIVIGVAICLILIFIDWLR
jgi:predicted nucleic acid-binding Zn ribbon protein